MEIEVGLQDAILVVRQKGRDLVAEPIVPVPEAKVSNTGALVGLLAGAINNNDQDFASWLSDAASITNPGMRH